MPNRHDDDDSFKPGSMYGKPDREESFQQRWIDDNILRIKNWLGGRPLIYCPGNHDYYDPTHRLRAEGIDFVNLGVQRLYEYDESVCFFGFPFCPSTVIPWNYATGGDAMQQEIDRMRAILAMKKNVILVAHAPPNGILDVARSGASWGNPALTSFLQYGGMDIKAVLCGHVHPSNGIFFDNDAPLIVSNAATTVHNLSFDFEVPR